MVALLDTKLRTSLARSRAPQAMQYGRPDRKSTRLNSSHLGISYADCCLKNKKGVIRRRVQPSHGRCEQPDRRAGENAPGVDRVLAREVVPVLKERGRHDVARDDHRGLGRTAV